MKFVYQYRTTDNVLHDGIVRAASREGAFSDLRAKGIRPAKLEEAHGIFNKLFGKGKRWLVILALGIAVVCLSLRLFLPGDGKVLPAPRHQIYGDPELMDRLEREEYASVFTDASDRWMARFAQPGTVVRFHDPQWRQKMVADLKVAPAGAIRTRKQDVREVQELKRIVLWMRKEYADFIAGGGRVEDYVRRMDERQMMESRMFEDVRNELETVTDPRVWEQKNKALRDVGLRTIAPPENN